MHPKHSSTKAAARDVPRTSADETAMAQNFGKAISNNVEQHSTDMSETRIVDTRKMVRSTKLTMLTPMARINVLVVDGPARLQKIQ